MTFKFPPYALECINTIEQASFEAYFVGGCVRDSILGRSCNDIDIATNALPNEIVKLFEHTVPTGIKHGTITVIIDGHPIEVTTYRTENDYADSRRPSSVNFISNINDDLARRDFTVNALAYNPKIGIIDLYGGINDLNSKIIRTVGKPHERFKEDALRILRAFRFASVLDFSIDKDTINSAIKFATKINNISGERVLKELEKLSNGKNPSIITDFINNSSLSEFGIHSLKHNLDALKNLSQMHNPPTSKFSLFISLFNHDIEQIKIRLKPDNKLYKEIMFLNYMSSKPVPKTKQELKLLLFKYGEDLVNLYTHYLWLLDRKTFDFINDLLLQINKNNEPYKIASLCINGNDLVKLGYSGEQIRVCLEHALLYVIDNPSNNDYNKLIQHIKN